MKKIKLLLVGIMSALVLALSAFPASTQAAFNSNLIMDDTVFNASNSMNAAQIDAFLNSFPSSCISTNNGFVSADVTGYNPSAGFLYGGNVSAGTVINNAAKAYDLNPQVILATLQKEQSLVSGAAGCHYGTPSTQNPCPEPPYGTYNECVTACQYAGGCVYIAMGYDCPYYCVPSSMGFSQQVIKAAWKLKFVQQRALGNYSWNIQKPGWDNSDDPLTPYSGYMTQGVHKRNTSSDPTYFDGLRPVNSNSITVLLGSGATASLYSYTPFTSGNTNFVNIFEGWFGSTRSCESPYSKATTLGIYDPVSATFYQRHCHSSGSANTTAPFGNANWIPLGGDWNGDGFFSPGAYDPTTGRFYLRNTNNSGAADISFQYGNLGWVPIVGDWNGNGYWSVGLYDPSTSTFYLKDFNGSGGADYTFNFGNGGWKPIAGDWDNNRSTTVGVYNPANAFYYLNDQHDGSAAERTLQFGNANWTPLAGDWDGNGWSSIGAYDSNSSTFYLRNMNSSGGADITTQYGNAGWVPVVGDWDGR